LAANRIIVVSNAVKKILIEDGIPEGKIDVVYSGIDLADFVNLDGGYLRKEFNIRKDEFIIGNIAALTEQKDHETLLRGVYLLDIDFKLFIVGEGHLRKKLERLSEKLKIKDRVIFTGFRKDARNFLKIFDLFVLTSKWEALGTSILDAMATGVAVVATNVGGISEMIEDGINGFLVPPRNPRKMSEKIRALVKDTALRKKFSKNGRRKVMEFTVEKMVSKTYEAYKKLLNEKNSCNPD
ncbi:MAG: glycosyltransferase family 4 protein, partial [Elusimicrobia bacterium]|nr:glycosyltransferase family 4 protein [Elusimicrobiota bacterium]